MTFEAIMELVIAICPSLVAVIGTIAMILKTLKQFADLKKDVVQMDKETIAKLQAQYDENMKKLASEAKEAVEAIRKATNDQLDYVSSQLTELLKENYELKKQLNKALTSVDHIKRD